MNVKKYFVLVLVILTGIVSSCKYDDDELWDNVNDLAQRVSALEALTQQINGDISAMHAIVSALENQVSVSEVENLTDGYIIHFTDGTKATIKNGADGEDGKDGADGEDGKDGTDGEDGKDGANGKDGKDGANAPAINVKQDNGIYYWTITVDGVTTWLTDDAGNKLPVNGTNGKDGADGEDGKDGVAGTPGTPGTDGENGKDGVDGKDGIVPQLKVDAEGYWTISYDNGATYDYVLNTEGKKVYAIGPKGDKGNSGSSGSSGSTGSTGAQGPQGPQGAQGSKGPKGDAKFQSVQIDGNIVIITTVDSVTFQFPLASSVLYYSSSTMDEEMDISGFIDLSDNKEIDLYYKLSQIPNNVSVEVAKKPDNVDVEVDVNQNMITLKATSDTNSDGKLILFFYTDNQTITSVLNIVTGDEYMIGKTKQMLWLANQVNNKGVSFEGKTIKLSADINLLGIVWEPIGTGASPFMGTFDGCGYQIKNLAVGSELFARSFSRANEKDKKLKGAGLFGVAKNAIFKNVTIPAAKINGSIDENTNADGAAALLGCGLGKITLEGVNVVKSEQNEKTVIEGSQNVSNLVGYMSGNSLKTTDCNVTGSSLSAQNVPASDDTSSEKTSNSMSGIVGNINLTHDYSDDPDNETVSIEITDCEIEGMTLDTTSDGSSVVGGIIGSITADEGISVSLENINVSRNSVSDATIVVSKIEGDGTVTNVTQGSVVGDTSSLGKNVSGKLEEKMTENNQSDNFEVKEKGVESGTTLPSWGKENWGNN